MWQSLPYGANYKAAYCLAVCPAGEDVIGPFLADRKTHLKEVVRPLQEKVETIYVTKNSDAEDHVAKRTFTGHEQRQATVVIQERKIRVKDGHFGQPDLHVAADSQTWIGFLRKEKNVLWALLRRKIRLAGPLKLLVAFGKCFPE